ncbi:MAG: two component regulator propeller domain protein [Chlorobi bacterium]|nr:two component regulator propeller domain protein [Chlorobiota bacterium]
MMLKHLLRALLVLAVVLPAAAQEPFSIATFPRSTELSFATATFSITIVPHNGFAASVFLSASVPSLPNADIILSPTTLNPSSNQPATLKVLVKGEKISGVHNVIIVGKNGLAEARDTVTIVIPAQTTWKVFNTDNSAIPSNSISKIAFDREGTGWIGTDKGLVRFDGANWTLIPGYPFHESFPNNINTVSGLCIDSSGGVWVTTGSGVASYRQGEWRRHNLTLQTYGYIYPDVATAPNGDVWVVTGEQFYQYHNGTWRSHDAAKLPLRHIAIDTSGIIWATYGAGLMKFDGTYQTIYSHDTDPSFPALFNASWLSIDSRGHVWVGGTYGLAELAGTTWTTYRSSDNIRDPRMFPGTNPFTIEFDTRGIAWVPNVNGNFGGVTRYDGTNRWFYTIGNSAIPSNSVATLRVKNDTSIWIGTYDGGLAILDGTIPPERIYLGIRDEKTPAATDGGLRGIVPNPATTAATIRIALKEGARVRLNIIDLLGREIREVIDGAVEGGEHDIPVDLTGLPAGRYFARLSANGSVSMIPLSIVR